MGLLTAHDTAVRARLSAASRLTGHVFGSVREAGAAAVADNYVLVFVTIIANSDGRRLTAADIATGDIELEVTVRVVAVDAGGLNGLLDDVREQLIGHRLVISGRAVTALGDEDLDAPRFDRNSDLLYRELTLTAKSSRT